MWSALFLLLLSVANGAGYVYGNHSFLSAFACGFCLAGAFALLITHLGEDNG